MVRMSKVSKEHLETLKKMTGCSYYVCSSNGTLYGGFTDMGAAETCMKKWQKAFDHDKLNKGTIIYIREV